MLVGSDGAERIAGGAANAVVMVSDEFWLQYEVVLCVVAG